MTTSTPAPAMMQVAFSDLNHELKSTRRLLERVPDEHFGWKPHEKSWSLGELSTHIVNLLRWQLITIERDELDFAAMPKNLSDSYATTAALLDRFDELAAAVQHALAQLDEAAYGQPWTLRQGNHVILSQPRAAVLRGFGLSHLIHHRGQLTVYLRLLDVPLPPLYGPTADEGMS